MNAADILTALRADGFELMAEGDRIRIEPGDRLTDEALSLIRAKKAELLRLLAANKPTGLPVPISRDRRPQNADRQASASLRWFR